MADSAGALEPAPIRNDAAAATATGPVAVTVAGTAVTAVHMDLMDMDHTSAAPATVETVGRRVQSRSRTQRHSQPGQTATAMDIDHVADRAELRTSGSNRSAAA